MAIKRDRRVDIRRLERNLEIMKTSALEEEWLRAENSFVGLLNTSSYLTEEDRKKYNDLYQGIKNCPVKALAVAV